MVFNLYDQQYIYRIESCKIFLTRVSDKSTFEVGLHYQQLIESLARGFDPLYHDQAESLFWELNRLPISVAHQAYEKKQLQDVRVYLHPLESCEELQQALLLEGVTLVATPELAAYQVYVPRERSSLAMTDLNLVRIMICFGFHGTRISPLLLPSTGVETYQDRLSWAREFCFQNYDYLEPDRVQADWAALMIRKQICDFSLERHGYQFSPETISLMRYPLPGNFE